MQSSAASYPHCSIPCSGGALFAALSMGRTGTNLLGVGNMTSLTMARLERQFKLKKEREAPPPAATSGLGAAIEELIQQQVAEQVEAAVEKQRPYQNPSIPLHRRPFTSKPDQHEFPPPPPHTAPPKDLTVQLTRNEVGRVHKVSIGKTNFVVMRDGEGKLIGMRQED